MRLLKGVVGATVATCAGVGAIVGVGGTGVSVGTGVGAVVGAGVGVDAATTGGGGMDCCGAGGDGAGGGDEDLALALMVKELEVARVEPLASVTMTTTELSGCLGTV